MSRIHPNTVRRLQSAWSKSDRDHWRKRIQVPIGKKYERAQQMWGFPRIYIFGHSKTNTASETNNAKDHSQPGSFISWSSFPENNLSERIRLGLVPLNWPSERHTWLDEPPQQTFSGRLPRLRKVSPSDGVHWRSIYSWEHKVLFNLYQAWWRQTPGRV